MSLPQMLHKLCGRGDFEVPTLCWDIVVSRQGTCSPAASSNCSSHPTRRPWAAFTQLGKHDKLPILNNFFKASMSENANAVTTSPDSVEAVSNANTSPNFVALEHEILEFWKSAKIFNDLQSATAGKPLFRFLDGPITANNPMGVHHAWGRTLKDIFIRFKNQTGHTSRFQNGFDCQGLWVEVEVEKELGFKGKPDIEAFGLGKFSEACKNRIRRFSEVQTQQSIRLGQWMDWDHSYFTHTDQNIQGIWRFLKRCFENGWLYRSYLPMPWCTRCGTSLSEHEMTGSYKEMKHLAVYFKLKVPALGARILVWTTTPWTLPANTALAVNPELEYSLVQVEGEDLPLLLSSQVFQNWSSGGWKNRAPKLLKTIQGTELDGLAYEPVVADLPVQKDLSHRIVLWKEVDPKEGTGVVHIAPGCGREDFELSKQVALERLIPIDEKGDYVKGYGFLEGKNAKKVANEVADYLQQYGKLYSKYQHEHSYPVCWRCKDELIFRLVGEWYIASNEIRPRLVEAAKTVRWQPEHIGKRMEDWLKNMGDWCISRKRFWGLPLPFYLCGECNELTVVGSVEELKKLSGSDLAHVPELHRPWIDEVKIKCPKCAATVSRVTEVGDCWLDAGIVPYSTNGCYDAQTGAWAPADWICEMSEQVRLWFYSMLFMGVTLDGAAPYKHVLTYERVLAEDGTKFSKTGYMIKFDEAAERMGVDTMRYYFASQPPTSDLRFGYAQGDETRRQLISLWNIYSFFMTYAQIDAPHLSGIDRNSSSLKLSRTDEWLLASVHAFEREARAAYETFNTTQVVRSFENFLDGLSNWYIRSNRRRFWKSESGDDKTTGYLVLFEALRTTAVIMAPIIPFLSEKIWQDCIKKFDPSAGKSVHLAAWPTIPAAWANADLVAQVALARVLINMGHRLRAEAKLKVRQPLAAMYVFATEETRLAKIRAAAETLIEPVRHELNVKTIKFLSHKSELFARYLELDLKKSGPVLKGDVGSVVKIVNALPDTAVATVLPDISAGRGVTLPGYPKELPAEIFVIRERAKANIASYEEGGILVALDTSLTPALEEEGWIRDILRLSQVLRKDSGLDVQDRIVLSVVADAKPLQQALERHRALIEQETLGTLERQALSNPLGTVEATLVATTGDKMSATISLTKRTVG